MRAPGCVNAVGKARQGKGRKKLANPGAYLLLRALYAVSLPKVFEVSQSR